MKNSKRDPAARQRSKSSVWIGRSSLPFRRVPSLHSGGHPLRRSFFLEAMPEGAGILSGGSRLQERGVSAPFSFTEYRKHGRLSCIRDGSRRPAFELSANRSTALKALSIETIRSQPAPPLANLESILALGATH